MPSIEELAVEIRDQILADVRDRRGWRQEWDEMDTDVRKEIRDTWRKMILNRLRDYQESK